MHCLEKLPPRGARFAQLQPPLPAPLDTAIRRLGVEQFYTHQAESIDAARRGEDIVVVTATASGKTLCYNAPVIEAILEDARSNAVYLFPTKALAQDQLRGLKRLAESDEILAARIRPGTYDGDTSPHHRRKIRASANVILTNPDMLHAGILPNHARWAKFLADLRFIVLDEIHTYRGIFGSNVACVMRRLLRICRHYGSDPQFICSSATIANPGELAERLTGRRFRVIDDDGSPAGRKFFIFWNPPFIDTLKMERRSSNIEAKELLVRLISAGAQTILFAKSRVVAELIYRYARQDLKEMKSPLAERICPYRGGYLPEERRRIEKRLFDGELLAVTSTNALELGIDVGSLDASIIVGYPGTIASTWQQAGRAGRTSEDSLAVLVAYEDAVDQYVMRHPEYFFEKTPEHAIVDPDNPYLVFSHLACAAAEKPVAPDELDQFGPNAASVVQLLAQAGKLKEIDKRWYWSCTETPSRTTNLRTISDDTFTIMEKTEEGNKVLGQVDSISAPELVYEEAVYLHEGETYVVRELDLDAKTAIVERKDVDYYTQPVLANKIQVLEEHDRRRFRDVELYRGDVTVTWATVMFTKFKFYTGENIGYKDLDLPPQHLETIACWLKMPPSALRAVSDAGYKPVEALVALRNMLGAALPVIAMCDPRDVGGNLEFDRADQRMSLFLYDRYKGGLGFAERGYECIEQLLEMAQEIVETCPCVEGCPSCVGVPNLRPGIHHDIELYPAGTIPNKDAARILLREVLGG